MLSLLCFYAVNVFKRVCTRNLNPLLFSYDASTCTHFVLSEITSYRCAAKLHKAETFSPLINHRHVPKLKNYNPSYIHVCSHPDNSWSIEYFLGNDTSWQFSTIFSSFRFSYLDLVRFLSSFSFLNKCKSWV